jgi:tripartite-type tricarboxylate transporter receptor subunit TctC
VERHLGAKGTPRDVIMKLNSVIRSALADTAVKQRLNELGQMSPPPEQPSIAALLIAERDRRDVPIRDVGFSLERGCQPGRPATGPC